MDLQVGWKERRLRRRADFQRTYRIGRRWNGRFLNVFSSENEVGLLRFGITVTRKSGGAVVRNRIRRQVREILRSLEPELPPRGSDLVVHVRPGVSEVEFSQLRAELSGLLRRALSATIRPQAATNRLPK